MRNGLVVFESEVCARGQTKGSYPTQPFTIWSLEIRRTSFLNSIKFTDLLIANSNCESAGQGGRF